MIEQMAGGVSLAEAYHDALWTLWRYGEICSCADLEQVLLDEAGIKVG